jgi:hypothetical protein
MDISKVAFKSPTHPKTITIPTEDYGDLVLRHPVASDMALVESLQKNQSMYERTFNLALRLAISINDQPGVTIEELGLLDLEAFQKLNDYCTSCFLKVLPNIPEEFVQKYLPNL